MTRLLVLGAVVVCAVPTGVTAASMQAYDYDAALGLVARVSLRVAVPAERRRSGRLGVLRSYVRCYRDRHAFESGFERRFGVSAKRVVAYYAGGSDVHLRHGTCTDVHSFLDGRLTVRSAAAYSILLHEALHRQGIRNERLTTCFANDAVRWGAERFGYDEARALRARDFAFAYTRIYSPRSYVMGVPTCLQLNRRRDWIDFR